MLAQRDPPDCRLPSYSAGHPGEPGDRRWNIRVNFVTPAPYIPKLGITARPAANIDGLFMSEISENGLEGAKPRRPRARVPFRQGDVTRAVKGAIAAGLNVVGVKVNPQTGAIELVISESAGQNSNPLDEWMAKHARQAEGGKFPP
jgi:hypothetical protein